jgi:hypothetical protein
VHTAISFLDGYGYRVRWYESLNLLVDLMNHSTSDKAVYIEVTKRTDPPPELVKGWKPVPRSRRRAIA